MITRLLILPTLILFVSCAPTYRVLDKKEVTAYYIENVKTKEVKMILSKRKLYVGGHVKIKDIPEIELTNGEYMEPVIWKVKKKK